MKAFKSQSDKLFEEILEKKIVPMLLEYKPFNDMIKYVRTPQMESTIKSLRDVMTTEKTQVLEANNIHKEKSRLVSNVLYLSNQLNNGNAKVEKELEETRNKILEFNDEIEKRENSIKELLVLKEEHNLQLLRETLSCCYSTIKTDEKELDSLLKNIEQLRKELENKRIKRDELQNRIDSTYGFIHGFMGAKETQKIDEHLL